MGPIPLPARQSLARARDSTPCTGVCVVLVKLKTPELGRAHAQWARSSAPPWAYAYFKLRQDVVVGNELLEGDHVTFVSYQQGGRRRASHVRATRSDGPGGRF